MEEFLVDEKCADVLDELIKDSFYWIFNINKLPIFFMKHHL